MFDTPAIEQVANAIQYIPADARDICVKVGQAIQNEFGEAGFLIWITWLQTGQGYNYKDMLAAWRSFKAGAGITIATLFYMARQHGYIPSVNKRKLSPQEISARKAERKFRQIKAKEARERKKLFVVKQLKKLKLELRPSGEPMTRYFYNRGLGKGHIPDAVMFHPALDYYENGYWLMKTPAVVSLVTDSDGCLEAVHKIHITEDGYKAVVPSPKKISTPINTISGCSIKLDNPTKELHLAEGLETAMAIRLATGKPAWCCLTASGLEKVEIPQPVKIIKIWADKDRSGVGERSANKLAQRLIRAEKEVHILLPDIPIPGDTKGIDWLDVYKLEKSL